VFLQKKNSSIPLTSIGKSEKGRSISFVLVKSSTLVLIIFTIVLGMHINKRMKKNKKVGKQFLLGFLVCAAFLSYYNLIPVEIAEKSIYLTASYLKTLHEGFAGRFTVTIKLIT
jgi:Na+/glutamate symporter